MKLSRIGHMFRRAEETGFGKVHRAEIMEGMFDVQGFGIFMSILRN